VSRCGQDLSQLALRSIFPRGEASRYTEIARYVDSLKADVQREREAWSRLYAFVGPGRSISQLELGEIRAALGQALFEARILKLASHLATNMINATPLDTSGWRNGKIVGFDPRHPERMSRQSPCRPIGPPPADYGQAPMSEVDLDDADRPFPLDAEQIAPGER
jgi:hypothetical protein